MFRIAQFISFVGFSACLVAMISAYPEQTSEALTMLLLFFMCGMIVSLFLADDEEPYVKLTDSEKMKRQKKFRDRG